MSVKAPKIPTAPKAAVSDKRPTAAVITNFLNNYYTNFRFADDLDNQTVTFRTVTEKNASSIGSKPVIDVSECEPFTAYSKVCEQLQRVHPDTKLTKEELEAITAGVYDGRLRGLLEIAANAVIKPPKEDKPKKAKKSDSPEAEESKPARVKAPPKENAFEKYVLPALRFGVPIERDINDYINAVNSFFTNKDKLRTRVYNLCFPHALHNPDKPAKGVNLIYLQHISRFHDDVLKAFVDGVEDRNILVSVQGEFMKAFKVDDLRSKGAKEAPKLEPVELEELKAQLLNPEIINLVLNPPTITNAKGETKVDPKWVDSLRAIKAAPKGKGILQLDRELTKFEKVAVRLLSNELNTVVTFLKLVRNAFAASTGESPKDCFADYQSLLEEIATFHREHKPKTKDQASFIKFLVETVMFLKDRFSYKSPLRGFIGELHTDVQFKFNHATRKLIDELIAGFKKVKGEDKPVPVTFDEQLPLIIDEFKKAWIETSNPSLYDVNKLELYNKLGKLVPAAIGKQYKVAVGILLVQYLFEQVRLHRAFNSKKKDLVIYVKL